MRHPLVLALLPLALLAHSAAAQMEFEVIVDPDGSPLGAYPNQSGLIATFQIYTTSLFEETVPLSCSRTGQVTAVSCPSSIQVPGNGEGSVEVQVTYSTGGVGSGTITLYATGGGLGDDQGSYNVTVQAPPPTITLVTPGTTVYTRTPLVLVKYATANGTVDTSTLVVQWGGTSIKALGRYNQRLFEWEVDGASHELAPGGMKQLYVYVCSVSGPCSSATRNVTLAASPRPILSLKPMPLEAHGRQFGAPFGPFGISGGGDIEMGVATPAYFSLNSPRTAGLTYSSRQSYPRALVNVDLEFPGAAPSALTVRLKDAGVKVDSAAIASPTCSSGGAPKCRIALEASFLSTSSYPAVRKWLTVEVQATVGGTYTVFDSVEVVLVDRRTTPYGSGWWPSGVMRLVTSGDDAILVSSDGNATVFRGAGAGAAYLAPPGHTATLVKTGSTWELRFRGGGKVTFDSLGRQTGIVDINGNTVGITYNTTDQVNRITDPIGKYFTFSYGNPNTTVSAITDPGGRQTKFVIDASRRLTSDSIPSGSLRYASAFTWNTYANSAVLPVTRANALGAAATITYTAGLRPWKVTLPTVPDEYGSNVQPLVQYYPQELKALKTLKAFTQLYTEIVDPRGSWARVELNRWGSGVRAWDTLGTVAVSTFDAVGRVLTSEGKVGDSTRVHYTYDAFGRLVRTHKVLNGGGIFRIDSLVYDAAHRVIRQVDPEGRIGQTVYDGVGRVSQSITPSGDTTRFWYTTYGQLDSTRGPTTTAATRFTYNATWRNTADVYAPGGALAERSTYDGYGRRIETSGKIAVQVTSTTTQMQWRRRLSFYNAANQVDSAHAQRTNNCDAPCNNPPAWPSPSDTLRSVTTWTTFNRLGLDSTRSAGDTLWHREVFRYDALGRLVQYWPRRRPPVDTLSVTYRYDIAGNPRFTLTRRGHTLEGQYDSRSRLTRRVLGATVGTFDYAYSGPNGELTAITAQSGYADPVGGSTVNASWTYNQSGQLLSETTHGNRTTTYAYSPTLLRLTSLTDAIGTRNVRYHQATGMADSVSDPTDGWVYYTLAVGRLNGPYVDGTGQDFSRTMSWRGTSGGLRRITNTHGYTVGKWEATEFEEDDTLTTKWTEQHGLGEPVSELEDSVTYDGWGRVTALKQLVNQGVVNDETFSFDARGNLTIDSSGATFNVKDQLTATAACSSSSYDPAGNLTQRVCGGVTWSYTYDALDRLTNVSNTAGLTAAYTYDVLGNRIAKKVGSTVTRFVWRSRHVIYETTGTGTITVSYQWGIGTDDLVAIHDHAGGGSDPHYYVVQDKLRSIRGLVRRDGTWKAAWRYRAYGLQLDSAGSAAAGLRRFRWAGAQYDEETGFYFLRTRYHDPAIGRFVQEDKIGRAGGANLYGYVGGQPLESRDPSGMAAEYTGSLPNCWNVFHCQWGGWHALDPFSGDGGGYRSVSAVPPGFFSPRLEQQAWWTYGLMLALDAFVARHPPGRPMTPEEKAAPGNGCDQVNCERVRIVEGEQFTRAFTFGYGIYVNGVLDVSKAADLYTLVHELWHVYQYQTQGFFWYVWFGTGSALSRVAFWQRPYSLPTGGPTSTNIWDYGFEQQGEIVAKCVTDPTNAWCSVSPWHK